MHDLAEKRSRKLLPLDSHKNQRIHVWMTPDEKRQIELAAAIEGIEVSTWARVVLLAVASTTCQKDA